MKATLKYPIFQFSPNENMVYTFWKENKTTQLVILNKCKGWKGEIVVDSSGTKYTVKRSYMTGWKGIHGFTGMSTGLFTSARSSVREATETSCPSNSRRS